MLEIEFKMDDRDKRFQIKKVILFCGYFLLILLFV